MFALAATAVVTKPAVRQEMLEAYEEGNANFYGLSHDAYCESVTAVDSTDGRAFYDVTKIESVASVDFVGNPAAGGRVLRLVASETVAHSLEKDGNMLTKMIEAIRKSGNAGLIAAGSLRGPRRKTRCWACIRKRWRTRPRRRAAATATQEGTTAPRGGGSPGSGGPGTATAQPATTAAQVTEAARTQEAAHLLEALTEGRSLFLENSLNGCSLPDPVKADAAEAVRSRDRGAKTVAALPAKAEITSAIKEQVDLFGQLAEAGVVQPATGRPRIEVLAGPARQGARSPGCVLRGEDGHEGHRRQGHPHGGRGTRRHAVLPEALRGDHRGQQVTGRVSEATG
jgi:hypothetical protein